MATTAAIHRRSESVPFLHAQQDLESGASSVTVVDDDEITTEKVLPTITMRTPTTLEKVSCLDGLRGIACLIVFNYHFLWPWTPHIMLGAGALPPLSPQPYWGIPFLPIICLLHRGRPMVAIFFAISGYVLCRHALKAIQERRLEAAYKTLASSMFRRAFRLYMPPMLSMLAVAVLAQVGAFRSEKDIFTGPDSRWINGTVTVGYTGRLCTNTTVNVTTLVGMSTYLGLSDPLYMLNVTRNSTAEWSETAMCLNSTSKLYGPLGVYGIMNATEQVWWKQALDMWISPSEEDRLDEHNTIVAIQAENAHNKTMKDLAAHPDWKPPPPPTPQKFNDWRWIQLGGSWEEHPIIHEKLAYAVGNLTNTYTDWGNPFNMNNYYSRYDPHTFTIPIEYRGSLLLYAFLLGTAALQFRYRFFFGTLIVIYCLRMGRWDMSLFAGGLLQSELDIHGYLSLSLIPFLSTLPKQTRTYLSRTLRWTSLTLGLYLLSYPDSAAEFTPGFMALSDLLSRYYHPLLGWMYFSCIGALLILPAVLHSPTLRTLLERPVPQYLGKISFSFYLMHGPLLHSLGFWIMPRLFDGLGFGAGLVLGYVFMLGVALGVAHWWHRRVDVWCMGVGKRVERWMLAD